LPALGLVWGSSPRPAICTFAVRRHRSSVVEVGIKRPYHLVTE
jgi:hypothetical protein